MRVLVVEDEEFLAELVAQGLRRASIVVDVCVDGTDGLKRALSGDYGVIVLDRDLPGVPGDEICRQVQARQLPVGILMLTAATRLTDVVEGFTTGADDYLRKPFAFDELLVRVRALGRRNPGRVPMVLRAGGVELDTVRRTTHRDGRVLTLTRKEFAVLEVLMTASGAVLSADDLATMVWQDQTGYDNNPLRVVISRLRAKLGLPALIETVPGVGYRFAEPATEAP